MHTARVKSGDVSEKESSVFWKECLESLRDPMMSVVQQGPRTWVGGLSVDPLIPTHGLDG